MCIFIKLNMNIFKQVYNMPIYKLFGIKIYNPSNNVRMFW